MCTFKNCAWKETQFYRAANSIDFAAGVYLLNKIFLFKRLNTKTKMDLMKENDSTARIDTIKSPSKLSSNDSVNVTESQINIHLAWKNLIVKAKKPKRELFERIQCWKHIKLEEKILLHNLSGAITGGMWAVMGPSGSGKSTLLNTLAYRLDKNTIVDGLMHINGQLYGSSELKKISGYVMQDDLLSGYLTIEETLSYIAELRLSRICTKDERINRVQEVLSQMCLSDVRHQVIGSPFHQGVSGSERKKLCVAIQLLTRPQLLFLDEPTTGLDSVTAFDLLQILYKLTRTNLEQQYPITVICSIHQPQFKIFELFDAILLLRSGRMVYQGPRNQVVNSLQNAGFPCPPYTNPADHLLDVITSTETVLLVVNQNNLNSAMQNSITDTDSSKYSTQSYNQKKHCLRNISWFREVQILLHRNIRQQSRKIHIIIVSVIQSIIMALLIGFAFYQVGNSQASIFRRESILFSCVVNQCLFNSLMIINSFPIERTFVLRERAAGTYHSSAYLIAKIFTDTFLQLPGPFVFSCIVYFMVGFQTKADKFVLFILFIILCSITSASIALMISALCQTIQMSLTILPMVLEVSRLFGGFLLAPSRIPKYFLWLDLFSYFKYTYIGLSINELNGLQLECNRTSQTCMSTGQTLIEERGFNHLNIPACIGILLAFILGTRIITYIGIRFFKS